MSRGGRRGPADISPRPALRHAERVMGTMVSFALNLGDLPEAEGRAALARACATLHEADETFSTYRPDSPLSRLRRGELLLRDAPADVIEVLHACAQARDLSGGWFDPWALPGGVDPTGLVKGWAAGRAAAVLRAAGLEGGLVNAAGDVVTFGAPAPGRPWRIGIRDPGATQRLACVVPVAGAIATSAHCERADQVLDPRTGATARGLLSATVVGPDPGLADALATGLLAAGVRGLAHISAVEGYAAYAIGPGRVTHVTARFPPTCPVGAHPRGLGAPLPRSAA